MLSGNGNKQILGPDGRPLIDTVGLAVLKIPRGHTISQKLLQNVAAATHCNVLMLPMECELVQGKYALEEMRLIHETIHQVEAQLKEKGLM